MSKPFKAQTISVRRLPHAAKLRTMAAATSESIASESIRMFGACQDKHREGSSRSKGIIAVLQGAESEDSSLLPDGKPAAKAHDTSTAPSTPQEQESSQASIWYLREARPITTNKWFRQEIRRIS